MPDARFSFGCLVVDTERFVIERDHRPVDVQTQVFDVLAYLLERRGRRCGGPDYRDRGCNEPVMAPDVNGLPRHAGGDNLHFAS
jgi:hypothetical protein